VVLLRHGNTGEGAMSDSREDLSQPWDGTTVPDAAGAVVRRIEGFSATPYQDSAGVWTIGYGTIRDEANDPVTAHTPPVTEAQALALQERDMQDAAAGVRRLVTVPLLGCEAAALISWTYNLGEGALGSSTMLKLLNAGNKDTLPDQMRRWINAGGKPVLGLLRRRWAEAAIFQGIDAETACNRAWKEITALGQWPGFTAGA
jgi:lysozyme